MQICEGQTCDLVWRKAARTFRHPSHCRTRSGRGGRVKELLHAVFVIHNPRERWVVSRCPAINPAFAIAEVVWILRGREDSRFLEYWNPALPRFAGNGRKYYGAYGRRLRSHFGIDQLERAYFALKRNPSGRQVVLQIWDPKIDFPRTNGRPRAVTIPCNVCALLKVREGSLHWTQILRSNDLFRGVPYNFVQFTMLQEVLAGWLNVKLGDYTHLSDSLHVYKSDQRHIRESIGTRPERNVDVLSLPKRISERAFAELERRMLKLMAPGLTVEGIQRIVLPAGLPRGFVNLLLVVAADAARRRGWAKVAQRIMQKCSNPVLKQLWARWFLRRRRPSNETLPVANVSPR